MPAFLIGSIGVLAETSHLQREAFNIAFNEAGLDWHWTEDVYGEMLGKSGGRQRIADYAAQRGQDVDADALHARKSEIFRQALAVGVEPRDGVRETLEQTRHNGWSLGFVTTTSRENVDAILQATGIGRDAFDVILDAGSVKSGKPAPDAYEMALSKLGADAADSIAVEDNPDGVTAAKAAGLTCFAFPGALHHGSDFGHADMTLGRLSPAGLTRSA